MRVYCLEGHFINYETKNLTISSRLLESTLLKQRHHRSISWICQYVLWYKTADTAALSVYCISRNIFSRRPTHTIISPPHPPLFWTHIHHCYGPQEMEKTCRNMCCFPALAHSHFTTALLMRTGFRRRMLEIMKN